MPSGHHHLMPAQSRRTAKAGVSDDTVRLPTGIESIGDLIAVPEQALAEA
ncbi:hypothetical protein GCM10010946_11060 [Undibacterium squillarum]|uniref:Uncharacterized protein n=1 Tax=Undibacterium squillarum TaxID=1131567 RepID=A0ABQ2XW41_9BURK|nr:hypothetical protein GCM10010946_11060 [Undibacterium squillarum]